MKLPQYLPWLRLAGDTTYRDNTRSELSHPKEETWLWTGHFEENLKKSLFRSIVRV